MEDLLAPLMLLPQVAHALADAEAAITSVSLPAKRHANRIGEKALAAAAIATCELDNQADFTIGASLIAEIPLLPELRTSPLQAMARLHAIAAVHEDEPLRGRPRSDFSENDRLLALVNVAASPSPAVLVAAIIHGELLALAPFSTANGLVARAMMRAVLIQRGIEPLIAPEIGIRDLGLSGLSHAIQAYTSATSDGVAEWIAFNARAVTFGVAALGELINQQ